MKVAVGFLMGIVVDTTMQGSLTEKLSLSAHTHKCPLYSFHTVTTQICNRKSILCTIWFNSTFILSMTKALTP